MTPALPYLLATMLIGAGLYGVLARRHAVLMLIGIELVLAGAGLILVSAGVFDPDRFASGMVLTMFLITIAAAEIVLALAVLMALYRARGHVDLQSGAGVDLQHLGAGDPRPGGVAE